MNKAKKVVFQINDLSISGGAERVVVSWVNYISERYKDIKVEILSSTIDKTFYKINKNIEIKSLNFNINEREYIEPKTRIEKALSILKEISPYRLLKLYSYFKGLNKNDVVIINKFELIRPLWILKKFALLNKNKFIYFYHGCSDTYLKNLSKLNRKFIFESVDEVIFLFDNGVYNLKSNESRKIRVLHNPLPFESDRTCNLSSKNILCVGRLSQEKRLDYLIRAWAKIENKNDWNLLIVGDGEKKEKLKELCEQLGVGKSVKFEGQQNDIKKYYLNSSIYVMTSETEGMPMVLLEAMECGMPIIAFNIPATKYLINGTGILVDNFCVENFANELNNLITNFDKRCELSQKSKLKATEFKIDKIAVSLEKILGI